VLIQKGLRLHQNCATGLSVCSGDGRWIEATGLTTDIPNIWDTREAGVCQEKTTSLILLECWNGGRPIALPGGRVGPPDGTHRELHPQVKAALWPGLAIHNSSLLRELTCQWSKERFFPGLPKALGHHASAVRADVPRKDPF